MLLSRFSYHGNSCTSAANSYDPRTASGRLVVGRYAFAVIGFHQELYEMFARYEAVEKALSEVQKTLRQKEKHNEQIEDFISEIEAMPDSITEFRTDYWGHLVEKVTVHQKVKLVFTFSCGVDMEV